MGSSQFGILNIKIIENILELHIIVISKGEYEKSLDMCRKALGINEFSYKTYILLALNNYQLKNCGAFVVFSNIAYEIYDKKLNNEQIENPCTFAEPWVYGELAIGLYYSKQYKLAECWGKVACSKNFTNEIRLQKNLQFYKNALQEINNE